MAPRITVLQPDPDDPIARLGTWLEEAGAAVEQRQLFTDAVPSLDQCGDAIILLGGKANALDKQAAPWITSVHQLLQAAQDAQLPTLGVCLGHQIIADCFGGTVEVGATRHHEQGATEITLTQAGRIDPILGPLDPTFIATESHNDAVTALPPGATVLATSDRCPIQALRIGSVVSVQFHPEVAPEAAGTWSARNGYDSAAITAGLVAHDHDIIRNGRALAAALVQATQRS